MLTDSHQNNEIGTNNPMDRSGGIGRFLMENLLATARSSVPFPD